MKGITILFGLLVFLCVASASPPLLRKPRHDVSQNKVAVREPEYSHTTTGKVFSLKNTILITSVVTKTVEVTKTKEVMFTRTRTKTVSERRCSRRTNISIETTAIPTPKLCPIVKSGTLNFDDLVVDSPDAAMVETYQGFSFPGAIDWFLLSTKYISSSSSIPSTPNALFSPARGNFVFIELLDQNSTFDLTSLSVFAWSTSSLIPSGEKLQFHIIGEKPDESIYPMIKIMDLGNGEGRSRKLTTELEGKLNGLRRVMMAVWWIGKMGDRIAANFLVDDLGYRKRSCYNYGEKNSIQ